MMCLSTIPKLEAHHWQARRRVWVIQVDVHESLRQKSTAVLKLLDLGAVLARLSVPITETTAEIIEEMRGHYAAGGARQTPGSWFTVGLNLESAELVWSARLSLADCISRSQYEVYSFQVATKHNLSEAAVDELLEMPSQVSFSCVPM